MTPSIENRSASPSRRALLAGALGGLGAVVASAIGRPAVTRAGSDGDVVLGAGNGATTLTSITNMTNNTTVFEAGSIGAGTGVSGISSSGTGVQGTSSTSFAVLGQSSTGAGVYGVSSSSFGVYGTSESSRGVLGISHSTTQAGSLGWSQSDYTGIQGHSGGGNPPAARANTGVYGYAAQDSTARGVIGETTSGHGVHAIATTGWAGYFAGRVYTSKYHEMAEITAPTAPAANHARLFLRDNGSAKTQLCVRFNTGSVVVLATQV
jgi:hypothetical protein